ncbi:MAG: hypothetical protein QG635_1641 [Bacteroidota bacterium]|nr:hypothetical protein [Bacteroidota bacterium]
MAYYLDFKKAALILILTAIIQYSSDSKSFFEEKSYHDLSAGISMGAAYPGNYLLDYKPSYNLSLWAGVRIYKLMTTSFSFDYAAYNNEAYNDFNPLPSINANFIMNFFSKGVSPYIGVRMGAAFITEKVYSPKTNNVIFSFDVVPLQLGVLAGIDYMATQNITLFIGGKAHIMYNYNEYTYYIIEAGVKSYFW